MELKDLNARAKYEPNSLRQQLAFKREVHNFSFGEKARAFRWGEEEAISWGFSMLK